MAVTDTSQPVPDPVPHITLLGVEPYHRIAPGARLRDARDSDRARRDGHPSYVQVVIPSPSISEGGVRQALVSRAGSSHRGLNLAYILVTAVLRNIQAVWFYLYPERPPNVALLLPVLSHPMALPCRDTRTFEPCQKRCILNVPKTIPALSDAQTKVP
ncbi:hypothetical protein BV25DRAFT_595517 [Artomyces pyxidatus]|uniref:Uncharacterized protein n=1 Tax=Artomyces pyxidatus TaxID=48021 RepID=A0ACB8T3J1_9AGAM|nr:hypothetical protein BV25DRAFT_595517 [Artomyces pyxidatus]